MKTSNLIRSAIILLCISLTPSLVTAQFDNFSGSWRSFNHQTHMEKLTEDDDNIVKFTEQLVNGVSDNGKKLIIGYYKSMESGQQSVQSYSLTEVMEGNITGSDEMNTVKFAGKITGTGNEQVISLTGNYVTGPGGVFGMELIYQNTETGKVLQMKLLLSVAGENPLDQTDVNNMYRGMEIETRPGTGDNMAETYWQVLYFKPE